MKKLILPILSLFCSSCIDLPENIQPIQNFDLNQYSGKWYEIARLDHRFERGLSNVTAEYSILQNGNVKVLNKGFSEDKQQWSTAEGKAKFVNDKNIGLLKVSFFGPFYAPYVIFELDSTNYQYAYVTSSSKKYLWYLSRTPQISDAEKNEFIKKVSALGFDTEKLIFVKHDR